MKIFVSWSGESSRETAERLGDWAQSVFQQSVETFVSSKDIEKGERWAEKLSDVLQDYNFGIVVLDASNKAKPWVNFEAGALSKSVSKSKLVPLLCGIAPGDLLDSPLSQFQSVEATREGLLELGKAINKNLEKPLPDKTLVETFEVWWDRRGKLVCEFRQSGMNPYKKDNPSVRDVMVRIDRLEAKIFELLSESEGRQDPKFTMTINDRMCRWPVGDASSEDFHFCGRPTLSNSPYCSAHAKKAFPSTEESKRR